MSLISPNFDVKWIIFPQFWPILLEKVLDYFCFSIDYGEIEIPPAPETVATYDITGPRLMISKIVNENFKSYAGVRALGPFHKVCHSPL